MSQPQLQTRSAFIRLAWLFQRISEGGLFTAERLAMEYEVNKNTIDRDLEALRQCGAIQTETLRDSQNRLWIGSKAVLCRCPMCAQTKEHKCPE